MLRSLLELVLKRRPVVSIAVVLLLGAGYAAFRRLNIEAYPDPSSPYMEIITQASGQSAEEMERNITVAVEIAMTGMPGLTSIRSLSLFGLSDVKVTFSYGTEYKDALQEVRNRLNDLSLPGGVKPSISPESAVGEIYRYQLKAPPGFDLKELKTLQDWVVEKRFRTVPGVIDVVGWGGLTKEYHVEIDLDKLTAYHVTLPQILTTLGNSNINVGAQTLDIGQQSANVRGIGLIQSLKDIDNIVLAQSNGTPVLLRDVAKSEIGHAPRLGIIGRDGDADIVEGIVLMRPGEKTIEVLGRIEAEVERINGSSLLPSGVRIDPYYNRRDLINVTTHTVLHNLVFGVILLFFIQYVFLGDLRSAIIVSMSVPVALFFSVLIMYLRGDSANLLSIGAIDFGIIIDATVILVENVFRHLSHDGGGTKNQKILAGASEVGGAVLVSTAIIIAAFIPLFTMQGVEGQIFAPMAKTYGYALLGALMATFTVAPVLSSFILPNQVRETEPLLPRILRPIYIWVLKRAINWRYVALGCAVVVLGVMACLVPQLGTEFLPKLEEGNLWVRAALPPTISLDAGAPYANRMRAVMQGFPEVITVVSQHGRPDDGTDPVGFFNIDFFVPLKPFDQWPKGRTKDKLVEEMQQKLAAEFTGIDFNFSQNIEDNVSEAVSGVKGENSVKLFGPDLKTLEEKAGEIKEQLAKVKGIEDLGIFTELGQPNVLIEVDRERCARYGLATGDVNAIVQAAIGGQPVTDIYEQERHFPLVARLMPRYRKDMETIKAINVPAPSGALVPLRDLCNISMKTGASYIYREANERYIPIKFSVRGRDLGSTVAEAQALVQKTVKLPQGYHLLWAGEFGELEEAVARLSFIVPLGMLLIVILLYCSFGSLRDSMLVLAGIPFAWFGGVLALYATGTNFSVSAAVGFISLLGVAVMAGIILLSYYNQLRQAGVARNEAVVSAAEVRMRPVLMMCMSACLGLLPAAFSTGIGSETQRPLAMVIVGGMALAPILVLLVLPVLISFFTPEVIDAARPAASPAPSADAQPQPDHGSVEGQL